MEPINLFLDPGLFSTNDIHNYLEERILDKLVELHENIILVENYLLPVGSKKIIFNFPIKKEIIYECLNHPPSCDPGLTKAFFLTFNIFHSKYFISCNKEISEEGDKLYENNKVPQNIECKFNAFIRGCIENKDIECVCKSMPNILPIYLINQSKLLKNNLLSPFENPEDVLQQFPLINFFPLIEDELNEQIRKLRFILEVNFFRRNRNFPQQPYRILNDFWNSGLLYDCDNLMKTRIIKVMTDLIESPASLRNKREKLNYETLRIGDIDKSLEQCYIFQDYRLKGRDITPRLRFTIHDNEINFLDIIDRHG